MCFGTVLTRVTWFFHICNSHIQEKKSDIFVVMETRSDPSNLKRAFSRVGFNGFYFSESRGFLYGISMGWKDDKLQVHILKCHFQFLHSRIIIEDGKTWHISDVYASRLEDRKRELWKKLKEIVITMNIGWLVGGDFKIFYIWSKNEVVFQRH